MNSPTDAQIAVGLHTELSAAVNRARDERFRLIHVIKETQDRIQQGAAAPTALQIVQLTQRIEKLSNAIDARFRALQQAEQRMEKRLRQLARLEADDAPQHSQVDSLIAARPERDAVAIEADRLVASMDEIVARIGPLHPPTPILEVSSDPAA